MPHGCRALEVLNRLLPDPNKLAPAANMAADCFDSAYKHHSSDMVLRNTLAAPHEGQTIYPDARSAQVHFAHNVNPTPPKPNPTSVLCPCRHKTCVPRSRRRVQIWITLSHLLGYRPVRPHPVMEKRNHMYAVILLVLFLFDIGYYTDLMTGSNLNMLMVTTVVEHLNETNMTSYNWICPDVAPNAAIYFYQVC